MPGHCGLVSDVSPPMSNSRNFLAVLDKTDQQVAEDINEFVEQFEASRRNQNNTDDKEGGNGAELREDEQNARVAAARCLDILVNIRDDARDAFDAAHVQHYPDGGIIAEAEKALRRIVQTEAMEDSDDGNGKFLDPAEVSGLVIRCRKYWKEHTDCSMDPGTKPSPEPYGEFLEFVSKQFDLDPALLFDRELEIRAREQALRERARSRQPEQTEGAENPA